MNKATLQIGTTKFRNDSTHLAVSEKLFSREVVGLRGTSNNVPTGRNFIHVDFRWIMNSQEDMDNLQNMIAEFRAAKFLPVRSDILRELVGQYDDNLLSSSFLINGAKDGDGVSINRTALETSIAGYEKEKDKIEVAIGVSDKQGTEKVVDLRETFIKQIKDNIAGLPNYEFLNEGNYLTASLDSLINALIKGEDYKGINLKIFPVAQIIKALSKELMAKSPKPKVSNPQAELSARRLKLQMYIGSIVESSVNNILTASGRLKNLKTTINSMQARLDLAKTNNDVSVIDVENKNVQLAFSEIEYGTHPELKIGIVVRLSTVYFNHKPYGSTIKYYTGKPTNAQTFNLEDSDYFIGYKENYKVDNKPKSLEDSDDDRAKNKCRRFDIHNRKDTELIYNLFEWKDKNVDENGKDEAKADFQKLADNNELKFVKEYRRGYSDKPISIGLGEDDKFIESITCSIQNPFAVIPIQGSKHATLQFYGKPRCRLKIDLKFPNYQSSVKGADGRGVLESIKQAKEDYRKKLNTNEVKFQRFDPILVKNDLVNLGGIYYINMEDITISNSEGEAGTLEASLGCYEQTIPSIKEEEALTGIVHLQRRTLAPHARKLETVFQFLVDKALTEEFEKEGDLDTLLNLRSDILTELTSSVLTGDTWYKYITGHMFPVTFTNVAEAPGTSFGIKNELLTSDKVNTLQGTMDVFDLYKWLKKGPRGSSASSLFHGLREVDNRDKADPQQDMFLDDVLGQKDKKGRVTNNDEILNSLISHARLEPYTELIDTATGFAEEGPIVTTATRIENLAPLLAIYQIIDVGGTLKGLNMLNNTTGLNTSKRFSTYSEIIQENIAGVSATPARDRIDISDNDPLSFFTSDINNFLSKTAEILTFGIMQKDFKVVSKNLEPLWYLSKTFGSGFHREFANSAIPVEMYATIESDSKANSSIQMREDFGHVYFAVTSTDTFLKNFKDKRVTPDDHKSAVLETLQMITALKKDPTYIYAYEDAYLLATGVLLRQSGIILDEAVNINRALLNGDVKAVGKLRESIKTLLSGLKGPLNLMGSIKNVGKAALNKFYLFRVIGIPISKASQFSSLVAGSVFKETVSFGKELGKLGRYNLNDGANKVIKHFKGKYTIPSLRGNLSKTKFVGTGYGKAFGKVLKFAAPLIAYLDNEQLEEASTVLGEAVKVKLQEYMNSYVNVITVLEVAPSRDCVEHLASKLNDFSPESNRSKAALDKMYDKVIGLGYKPDSPNPDDEKVSAYPDMNLPTYRELLTKKVETVNGRKVVTRSPSIPARVVEQIKDDLRDVIEDLSGYETILNSHVPNLSTVSKFSTLRPKLVAFITGVENLAEDGVSVTRKKVTNYIVKQSNDVRRRVIVINSLLRENTRVRIGRAEISNLPGSVYNETAVIMNRVDTQLKLIENIVEEDNQNSVKLLMPTYQEIGKEPPYSASPYRDSSFEYTRSIDHKVDPCFYIVREVQNPYKSLLDSNGKPVVPSDVDSIKGTFKNSEDSKYADSDEPNSAEITNRLAYKDGQIDITATDTTIQEAGVNYPDIEQTEKDLKESNKGDGDFSSSRAHIDITRFVPKTEKVGKDSTKVNLKKRVLEVDEGSGKRMETASDARLRKDYLVQLDALARFNTGVRNNLTRSFPTYALYFHKEFPNREIQRMLVTDVYMYQNILDFSIRSDKYTGSVATMKLANIWGTLDNDLFKRDPRIKAIGEKSATYQKDRDFLMATFKLAPGTVVELRHGHSSNLEELETVFTGKISEVSAGDIVTVIMQGHEHELMNKVRMDLDIGVFTGKNYFDYVAQIMQGTQFFGEPFKSGETKDLIRYHRAHKNQFNAVKLTTFGDFSANSRFNIFLTSRMKASRTTENIWVPNEASQYIDWLMSNDFRVNDITKLEALHEISRYHYGSIVYPMPYDNRATLFMGSPSQEYKYTDKLEESYEQYVRDKQRVSVHNKDSYAEFQEVYDEIYEDDRLSKLDGIPALNQLLLDLKGSVKLNKFGWNFGKMAPITSLLTVNDGYTKSKHTVVSAEEAFFDGIDRLLFEPSNETVKQRVESIPNLGPSHEDAYNLHKLMGSRTINPFNASIRSSTDALGGTDFKRDDILNKDIKSIISNTPDKYVKVFAAYVFIRGLKELPDTKNKEFPDYYKDLPGTRELNFIKLFIADGNLDTESTDYFTKGVRLASLTASVALPVLPLATYFLTDDKSNDAEGVAGQERSIRNLIGVLRSLLIDGEVDDLIDLYTKPFQEYSRGEAIYERYYRAVNTLDENGHNIRGIIAAHKLVFAATVAELSKEHSDESPQKRAEKLVEDTRKNIEYKINKTPGYQPFRKHHQIRENDIVRNEIECTTAEMANEVHVMTPHPTTNIYESVNNFVVDTIGLDPTSHQDYWETQKVSFSVFQKPSEKIIRRIVEPNAYTSAEQFNIASRDLAEAMKPMYRGAITILGKKDIKPYDIIHLEDSYNNIYGAFEVEARTHNHSMEHGWTTTITPHLINIYAQRSENYLIAAMQGAIGMVDFIVKWGFISNVVKSIGGKVVTTVTSNAAKKVQLTGLNLVESVYTDLKKNAVDIAINDVLKPGTGVLIFDGISSSIKDVLKSDTLSQAVFTPKFTAYGRGFNLDQTKEAEINSKLSHLRPVLISPLTKDGKPWVAGLNGIREGDISTWHGFMSSNLSLNARAGARGADMYGQDLNNGLKDLGGRVSNLLNNFAFFKPDDTPFLPLR